MLEGGESLVKIFILDNNDLTIYNFRKEFIERLIQEKYQVYIISPYGERIEYFIDLGCKFLEVSINRHGKNPFEDFKLLNYYRKKINEIKPDIVLSYTIKPNIYGGIACRITKTPYIANITGLGTGLQNKGFIQKILVSLYEIAFKKISCIFFQNKENQQFFLDRNISKNKQRIIPGSGVNIYHHEFKRYPPNNGMIKFLFMGRITKDKGIEELIEAAKIIKSQYSNIEFDVIGPYEKDYAEEINRLEDMDVIKFHGMQKNVLPFIKDCNAVILPSYHEGMSNTLLEAASTGRPILASNINGCKEIFTEEITGLGFECECTESLVETIKKFINLTYAEKKMMGSKGREKMKKEFNRDIVIDAYMEEIDQVI